MQQRSTLGELSTPFIKYVVWSADMSAVALLSKHAIIIANKRLGGACTVHETIRVKVPPNTLLYTKPPSKLIAVISCLMVSCMSQSVAQHESCWAPRAGRLDC